jgi:single-strand selective monofunctional uracil DNA glycosylase
MRLATIANDLARHTAALRFREPTAYVYNPLRYARRPHVRYLELWGKAPKEVLLLGMNPGPFGMAQTGVPFGEVSMVRDWLRVKAPVTRPQDEHPKRPIEGFSCTRSEVSGARLWGWARDRFGTPEAFFARFFVANYCPLVFMEESGRNRTPDKLPAAERDVLFALCDEALAKTVAELKVHTVLGVGAFAEKRAREALAGTKVRVAGILHPSPASPLANRGWQPQIDRQMAELGIALP